MLPTATAVANPALLIVATPGFVDVHVTAPLMFTVLLSLYSPVAVNACVKPLASDLLAGVTVIETSVAVTVSVVDPLTLPKLAPIVVAPVPTPVANPPLLIVATEVLEELQVTELVRVWVLLSL